MRILRIIIMSFVAVPTVAVSAPTGAEQVDEAYQDFLAGRYGLVFQSLLPYRIQHEGTLRVDFMLAVSGCRLSDGDFRALGGLLLAAIPNWYKPLPSGHLEDIRRQAEACPSTGITEKEAISRLSGKAESLGAERLAVKRSDSGKDQPLPRAPIPSADVVVPPPSGMGALIEGRNYSFAEYRVARVASAAECSALCAHDERCAAMSFYVDQKLCSLKDRVSTFTDSGNVISAVKLRRR